MSTWMWPPPVEIPERHRAYFDLILANRDIFPGFFHVDLKGNVLPKLAMLREFGFYPKDDTPAETEAESCGAHSPHAVPQGGGVGVAAIG